MEATDANISLQYFSTHVRDEFSANLSNLLIIILVWFKDIHHPLRNGSICKLR
jgi:hypothetical protein